MLRLGLVIKTGFTEILSRIREVVSRKVAEEVRKEQAGLAPSASDEAVRKSPVMASLFPCFHNKKHPHPTGKPHTCNSFLLGPSDYTRREGVKIGAHTLIVSHWKGAQNAAGRKVAA